MDEEIIVYLENETTQKFNTWLEDCFEKLSDFYHRRACESGVVYKFHKPVINGKETGSYILAAYNIGGRIERGIILKWIEVGTRLKVMIAFPSDPKIIHPIVDILTELHNDFPDTRDVVLDTLRGLKSKYQIENSILPLDGAQAIENKSLVVKLNRNDVYRQLLALCNDGEIFSLQQGDYKDKELECLSVADRKEITAEKMNIPLRKKILGYIRLLPNNDETRIVFVHKNRPEWYDYPVINPELWDSFVNAVFEYFKSNAGPAPQVNAVPVDAAKTESEVPKTKKTNLQTIERATIYRHLSPWIKSMKVRPTAKDCIQKIKEQIAYKEKKITRQRMERILREGISGEYDEILKNMH